MKAISYLLVLNDFFSKDMQSKMLLKENKNTKDDNNG